MHYCPTCYRSLPDGRGCHSCDKPPELPGSRVLLILGVVGVPILGSGILRLDARLCVAGTGVMIVAVLLHVILRLRG